MKYNLLLFKSKLQTHLLWKYFSKWTCSKTLILIPSLFLSNLIGKWASINLSFCMLSSEWLKCEQEKRGRDPNVKDSRGLKHQTVWIILQFAYTIRSSFIMSSSLRDEFRLSVYWSWKRRVHRNILFLNKVRTSETRLYMQLLWSEHI